MVQRVYSKNAAYQSFEVLRANRNKRYRRGAFLVEGVRNINAARKYGWTFEALLYPGETALSGWARELLEGIATPVNYQLAPGLMADISGKEDTSEMLAIVSMRENRPESLRLSPTPLLALFDRPSNRGNLGSILRSCDALGVEALFLTGHGVDPYDADVISASMGSFFRVPFFRPADNEAVAQLLSSLRRRYPGFQVIGTTAHRALSLYRANLRGPLLFMLGNETEGLNRHFLSLCDSLVTIPMAEACDASSLNVACAASILFAEAGRQRGKNGE